MFFSNTAHAQTAAASAPPGWDVIFVSYLPIILIFGVFYFMVIRPQLVRAKEHREMVAALRRGDKIITSGGLHAEVTNVVDADTLEIALNDTTTATLNRSSVVAVISKPSVAETVKTDKKLTKKSKK